MLVSIALPSLDRGGCQAFQIAVQNRDGGSAIAYGRTDPFDRAAAHVTGGEDARQAGLMQQRRPVGGPAGSMAVRVVQQVRAGEDEAPPAPRDRVAEPFGPRFGTNEDEQGVGRDRPARLGLPVFHDERFETVGAGATGYLHPVGGVDVRRGGYLADLADLRQHLDAVRVGLTGPPDDQRDRRSGPQQLPDPGVQLRRLVTDDDLVVHAIAPRQLLAESLQDGGITANDDDRRPPAGGVSIHGLLLRQRADAR